jgi:hypothetical protein
VRYAGNRTGIPVLIQIPAFDKSRASQRGSLLV